MNDRALGGLFLLSLGGAIAVLWYRGYFSTQIAKATGGLASGGPTRNDITLSPAITTSLVRNAVNKIAAQVAKGIKP